MKEATETNLQFSSFAFSENIQKGIDAAGFTTPSPIQSQSIPLILEGRDVIAQAQTGTGKTAAFGLPLMNRYLPSSSIAILVITPTRELAMQVSVELGTLGKFAGAKVASVYGGASARSQIDSVRNGANIVVGTPGRLLDLIGSGRMKMSPKAVVLDEADRMLDMGFLEDIEKIFHLIRGERQTLLFSATLPAKINELSKELMNNPAHVKTQSLETALRIKEVYYVMNESEKEEAFIRLMNLHRPDRALIFCKTKRETDALSNRLSARNFKAGAIHGDLEQSKRERVLRSFKNGDTSILVATDVAARGLDIQGLSHVFNYHVPFDSEGYVHRIGRTGRAGSIGLAISLVSPGELRSFRKMIRDAGGRCQFNTVPTLNDVRRSHRKSILQTIQEQKPDPANEELLNDLVKGLDIRELALRLLSLVQSADTTTVGGPDKIGKTAQDVESLGRDDPRHKPGKGKKNRARFKAGGGGHSGGGHSGGHGHSGHSRSGAGGQKRSDRSDRRDGKASHSGGQSGHKRSGAGGAPRSNFKGKPGFAKRKKSAGPSKKG